MVKNMKNLFLIAIAFSVCINHVFAYRQIRIKRDGASDPEINMEPDEIIRRWGFPAEKHYVRTTDGYILTVFRIPHGRNGSAATANTPKPVVLFQHGIDASCVCFVSGLPHQDAAYIFADAGFDVWLGNFRGNVYGRRHVTLSPDDRAFWEFSWDEMAKYDMPALIDYALNVSSSNALYYVGHSMATTTAFALLSEDQVVARKVRRLYALGPIAVLKNVKGLSTGALRVIRTIDSFMARIGSSGLGEFMSNNPLVRRMVRMSCSNAVADLVCANVLFLTEGPSTNQLNTSRLPVYMARLPAGTSFRTFAHFAQMVKHGYFQKYDFRNKQKNRERYGTESAPYYNLSKIEAAVGLFWGDKDYLAAPEDVRMMIPQLRNLVLNVYLRDFNHVDFIWGLRAAEMVYTPMMNDIKNDFQNRIRNV